MKPLKYLLILLFTYLCIGYQVKSETYDSLRLEKKKGKSFIVHRVEPKETLFSISKRYGASITDINNANPSLKNGLKMYQELFVPYFQKAESLTKPSLKSNSSFHIVAQGETMYAISKKYSMSVEEIKNLNDLPNYNLSLGDTLIINRMIESKPTITKPDTVNETPKVKADSTKYHIVAASETLYSISSKYNLDLNDIKKWNNLSSNSLDIGQKLLLKNISELPKKLEPIKIITRPIDTLFVTTDTSRFKTKIKNVGNIEKTIEEGFATRIHKTEGSKKYLALHRKAPVGTVIEVKNQMNNLSIFARVVGKLPETGLNSNVLIRLSHAAYKKLGALDAKIPVEIGFVIE